MVHYILYGQESGKWTKVYLACHSSEVGDVVIEKRGETPETFQVYVLKQIGAGSSGVVPASWAAQVHGEKKHGLSKEASQSFELRNQAASMGS